MCIILLLTDDDECDNGLHNCDINANCINMIGSFECTCNDGYLGNGTTCISNLKDHLNRHNIPCM